MKFHWKKLFGSQNYVYKSNYLVRPRTTGIILDGFVKFRRKTHLNVACIEYRLTCSFVGKNNIYHCEASNKLPVPTIGHFPLPPDKPKRVVSFERIDRPWVDKTV